jgi:glycosyltransferase involved in cell wall biosynthesis
MKRPFFSIITPTLQRDSLVACCESVDAQTLEDGWEHIVVADADSLNADLAEKIRHPNRKFVLRDFPHASGHAANKVRHEAWKMATGDYVYYLDDDNTLADSDVLQAVKYVLLWKGVPLVAFFPIIRLKSIFMPDGDPVRCHVDTANLVVAREVGQWPDIEEYTSDGIFIESLVKQHRYLSFPHFNPIAVMPVISGGK